MAKLYFRYSAMNAGKSTALMQVAHNYEELGERVAVFTAAIDTRSGSGQVASRLGLRRAAQPFDAATDFARLLADAEIACVLVDEAQFLTPDQVSALHRYAHLGGVPVICYGIRSDFVGVPFPGATMLLTLADAVEEIKTVCSRCRARKATMNPRVDPAGARIVEGEQIGIEGQHVYAPMCARCFYETEPKTARSTASRTADARAASTGTPSITPSR